MCVLVEHPQGLCKPPRAGVGAHLLSLHPTFRPLQSSLNNPTEIGRRTLRVRLRLPWGPVERMAPPSADAEVGLAKLGGGLNRLVTRLMNE